MNKILSFVLLLLLCVAAVAAAPITVQDGALNVSGNFWVNLSKLVVDSGGGSVGIGTNNPTAPLEVVGLIKATNWSNVTIVSSQVVGGGFTDTNETTRFNALVNSDCSGTDKVTGVLPNGTVVCGVDTDTDTTYTNGTGISLSGTTFSIILSYFQGLFVELTDNFGGDVSGAYNAVVITDNSHLLHYNNITGANSSVSQMINDTTDLITNNSDAVLHFLNVTSRITVGSPSGWELNTTEISPPSDDLANLGSFSNRLANLYSLRGRFNVTSEASDFPGVVIIRGKEALRIEGPEGFYLHGGQLNFGDGDYVHLQEVTDDYLEIKGTSVWVNAGGFNSFFAPTFNKSTDLGTSGYAWDDLYYDDSFNLGSPDWSNVNVLQKTKDSNPIAKKDGTFDAFKADSARKEVDPKSIPQELTDYQKLKYEYKQYQQNPTDANGKPKNIPPNPDTMEPERLGIWTNGMTMWNYQAIDRISESLEISNSTGLVNAFTTPGADYAEYLQKSNPADLFSSGQVVGVKNGKVSLKTEGADSIMVISNNAGFIGNKYQKDGVAVAFTGQVEVKVKGAVHSGDYLLPSGNNDGIALAVPADSVTFNQYKRVIGIAWEDSKEEGVKQINTAIGIK